MRLREGLTVDYNTVIGNGQRSPTVERAWGLVVQTDNLSSILAIRAVPEKRSVDISYGGTKLAVNFITVANDKIHIPDQSEAMQPFPEEMGAIKQAMRGFAH